VDGVRERDRESGIRPVFVVVRVTVVTHLGVGEARPAAGDATRGESAVGHRSTELLNCAVDATDSQSTEINGVSEENSRDGRHRVRIRRHFGGLGEDDERRVAGRRSECGDDGPKADRLANVQRHRDDGTATTGRQAEEHTGDRLQPPVIFEKRDDAPAGSVLNVAEEYDGNGDERADLDDPSRTEKAKMSNASCWPIIDRLAPPLHEYRFAACCRDSRTHGGRRSDYGVPSY
jgi:hypothetical protein